jgi:hypothetical protein
LAVLNTDSGSFAIGDAPSGSELLRVGGSVVAADQVKAEAKGSGAAAFLARTATCGSISRSDWGSPGLEIYSSGNENGAYMHFHRGGIFMARLGLDTDNILKYGGWSSTVHRVMLGDGYTNGGDFSVGGNVNVTGSVRASSVTFQDSAHFISGEPTGSYGSARIAGSRNGWSGIDFSDASQVLMVHPNYQGFLSNQTGNWQWRFDNGTLAVGTVPWANISNKPVATPSADGLMSAADKAKLDTLAATPAGQVAFYATANAPAGWLVANGAAVSRTQYARLFAAIGTMYGAGDGSSTFNLPDLRGEFVRGADQGRGVDPNRAVGSKQADDFKSHQHGGTIRYTGPVNHTLNGGFATITTGHSYDGGNASGFTGGTETRPRNVALLPCISY